VKEIEMEKVTDTYPVMHGDLLTEVEIPRAAEADVVGAPECVWMHNSLGYWFSVADECKEAGDVEYVRADLLKAELDGLREALRRIYKLNIESKGEYVVEAKKIARSALASSEEGKDKDQAEG
jgi:hypothetical protein